MSAVPEWLAGVGQFLRIGLLHGVAPLFFNSNVALLEAVNHSTSPRLQCMQPMSTQRLMQKCHSINFSALAAGVQDGTHHGRVDWASCPLIIDTSSFFFWKANLIIRLCEEYPNEGLPPHFPHGYHGSVTWSQWKPWNSDISLIHPNCLFFFAG